MKHTKTGNETKHRSEKRLFTLQYNIQKAGKYMKCREKHEMWRQAKN